MQHQPHRDWGEYQSCSILSCHSDGQAKSRKSVLIPLARSHLLILGSGQRRFRAALRSWMDIAPTIIVDWTIFETIRPVHASLASVEFSTQQVPLGSIVPERKPLAG